MRLRKGLGALDLTIPAAIFCATLRGQEDNPDMVEITIRLPEKEFALMAKVAAHARTTTEKLLVDYARVGAEGDPDMRRLTAARQCAIV